MLLKTCLFHVFYHIPIEINIKIIIEMLYGPNPKVKIFKSINVSTIIEIAILKMTHNTLHTRKRGNVLY